MEIIANENNGLYDINVFEDNIYREDLSTENMDHEQTLNYIERLQDLFCVVSVKYI